MDGPVEVEEKNRRLCEKKYHFLYKKKGCTYLEIN